MTVDTLSKPLLVIGRFISTPTASEISIRHGAVLVSRTGTIEKVNWEVKHLDAALKAFEFESKEDVEVVESGEDGYFFPGFVDTHIHAPQYPNAGLFGKSTLLDWLQTYTFPLESSLGSKDSPMYDPAVRKQQGPPHPLERAKTVFTRVIQRTLAHGTTTATYYSTNHVSATKLLFDLAYSIGQRSFIGRACMDNPATCPDYYRDPSTEATIAAEHECIAHAKSLDPTARLVAPIITPRFAPSCLPTTLTALGELAASTGLRVQTHISENLPEVSLVQSMFPESKSYADVYDTHGLLTQRTVLAHAVYLTPDERALIKQRGSKIAHCPASNSALGSGMCPVRTYLDEGLTIGLGTDVSGGYSPSILEVVRQACLVSRTVGFSSPSYVTSAIASEEAGKTPDPPSTKPNLLVSEALHLATVGGAKVLGLEDKIGQFEVGFNFDVQQITLPSKATNVDIFGWETWEERVEKWVWGGDDRNVKRVWVGGQCVHEA